MYIFMESKEYPITLGWIKENNKNISFPEEIDDDFMKSLGFAPVTSSGKPSFDMETQKIVELPPKEVDGAWHQCFEVQNLTKQEQELRKTELAAFNETLAQCVRDERDKRIRAHRWLLERHSDELAVGDPATLTDGQYQAWLRYMQALRDMPGQADFPWDGGGEETPWPEVPE